MLQTAGLFHAAYGTAGFDEKMVSLEQHQEIAQVIGREEEALVYLYCSCDRDYVFPQFGQRAEIEFKDRFSGLCFKLEDKVARLFCDLTVANELELIYSSNDFKLQHAAELLALFQSMDSFLSDEARKAYKSVLACAE